MTLYRAVIRCLDDLEKVSIDVAKAGLLDGTPKTITLQPFKRPRTLDQNAMMHVMFRELASHCGYTESEIKEYFKQEHGYTKTIEISGKITEIPKPTSEYNVEECTLMIYQFKTEEKHHER